MLGHILCKQSNNITLLMSRKQIKSSCSVLGKVGLTADGTFHRDYTHMFVTESDFSKMSLSGNAWA